MSQSEFSEEAIEAATRYLVYHDPENASRENALKLLGDALAGHHSAAEDDPEGMSELRKLLEKSRDNRLNTENPEIDSDDD